MHDGQSSCDNQIEEKEVVQSGLPTVGRERLLIHPGEISAEEVSISDMHSLPRSPGAYSVCCMLTVEHCLSPVEKTLPHDHPFWGLEYCGGSDQGSIVYPLGRRRNPVAVLEQIKEETS